VKLVVAIIHNDDARGIVDALLAQEYRATRLDSSGGFLRKSNATLLIVVDDSAVDDVILLIRSHAKPRTQVAAPESAIRSKGRVDLRAAIVFVINLESFVRL